MHRRSLRLASEAVLAEFCTCPLLFRGALSLGFAIERMEDSSSDSHVPEEGDGVMARRAAMYVHRQSQLLQFRCTGE